MTNDSIRIAVGLRLGAPLCIPHNCPLCGNPVDYSGVHGLSCCSSRGRIPRHTALNGIVHRALATANVPATLEPHGLCRGNGKRPDGKTITPWFRGKLLVWNVTCWDSFTPININLSSTGTGLLANHATAKKRRLYQELTTCHRFVPIAFESTDAFGKDALNFIREVAKRSRNITKDPLSYLKLCQQISVCIQFFNTASIL